MRSDPYVLMHWAKRTNHRPFFHRDMSGQRSGVYQHGVVANLAIMANVGVGHDQDVAADTRYSAALCRSPRDGYVFPDDVVIAHFQTRGLAPIADVLWTHAQRRKWINLVVAAEATGATEHDMRYQFAVFA